MIGHLVVHVGIEELVPGLSGAFGHIHGEVGLAQQFRSVPGAGVLVRYAYADGDGDAVPVQEERHVQGAQDAFGNFPGRVRVSAGDDDGEFIPAQARDDVPGADAPFESGRQADQQRVPALVAQGIVDVFEVIDVNEEQALTGVLWGGCQGRTTSLIARKRRHGWPARSAGPVSRGG